MLVQASPALEVADVIRAHAAEYLASQPFVPLEHRRVLRDLADCRTAALGGHKLRCPKCGHLDVAYNACRNRHCPKCQGGKQAEWLADQQRDRLDAEYFHVVFTVPDRVADLALTNKRVLYNLLFEAAAQTLTELAADPAHLGCRLGFLAVLHTWTQTLRHHPHVHIVVPGGGPSLDDSKWIACQPGFFLPVRVMSQVFRGKFLAKLKAARKAGRLKFIGKHATLADDRAFTAWLQTLRRTDWVVHAKKPFGGPDVVLKYLARYTSRTAISNRRLVAMENGQVTFTYKDGKRERTRAMTLPAVEFLRRFLLHVLPTGFVRIRRYGFLSNRNRATAIPTCRQLIAAAVAAGIVVGAAEALPITDADAAAEDATTPRPTEHPCPKCGTPMLPTLTLHRRPSNRSP